MLRTRHHARRTHLPRAIPILAALGLGGPALAQIPSFGASDAFSLNLRFNMQTRYLANWRNGAGPNDNFTHGFTARRFRMILEGSALAPSTTYLVLWDWARDSSGPTLLDATLRHRWDSGFSLSGGQLRPAFFREELMSHTNQLAAERSQLTSVFSTSYGQGLEAEYRTDDLRLTASFTDGASSLNAPVGSNAQADWALTTRVEYAWTGGLAPWWQFTSFREGPLAAYSGAALHVQSGGNTGITRDRGLITWTVDSGLKGDGWNTFATYAGRQVHERTGATRGRFLDQGLLAQGGLFVSDRTEVFVRWEHIRPDPDRDAADASVRTSRPFHAWTPGVNFFLAPRSHAAKLTVDLVYVPTATSATSSVMSLPNLGAGLLPSSERNQFVLRTQFQIVF
jgi:hypothetical protein